MQCREPGCSEQPVLLLRMLQYEQFNLVVYRSDAIADAERGGLHAKGAIRRLREHGGGVGLAWFGGGGFNRLLWAHGPSYTGAAKFTSDACVVGPRKDLAPPAASRGVKKPEPQR